MTGFQKKEDPSDGKPLGPRGLWRLAKSCMTLSELVNPSVLTQPVYEPGKPIEDVARELGLDPAGIVKLASNENPLGASPLAVAAAIRALAHAELYPDGGAFALRQKLATMHGLSPGQFVIGNGSNEILELLGHVFLRPGDEVVMGAPAFIVYKLVALLFGARAIEVPLVEHRHDLAAMARAITPRTKLVFLPSPNNPTGTANTAEEIEAFVCALPEHVVFAFDEAYVEYLDNPPDLRPLIAAGKKVIGLRTFSKIYGLAALRVGYGYASPELAGLLNRVRQPFNVNSIGQAAALAALDDAEFVSRTRAVNAAGLLRLESAFTERGLEWVPSVANFMLVKVGDAARGYSELQKRGVIVRPMKPYGMPEWLRVTVGNEAQNTRLLAAFDEVFGVVAPGVFSS